MERADQQTDDWRQTMPQTLHHIAIIVSSEKSVEFYARLGFEIIKRISRPARHDEIVLMQGYGTRLELFVDATHPPRAENPEPLGLRHIALQVDNIEDFCKKHNCSEIKTDWLGEKYAFITDPDGLMVEIHG